MWTDVSALESVEKIRIADLRAGRHSVLRVVAMKHWGVFKVKRREFDLRFELKSLGFGVYVSGVVFGGLGFRVWS